MPNRTMMPSFSFRAFLISFSFQKLFYQITFNDKLCRNLFLFAAQSDVSNWFKCFETEESHCGDPSYRRIGGTILSLVKYLLMLQICMSVSACFTRSKTHPMQVESVRQAQSAGLGICSHKLDFATGMPLFQVLIVLKHIHEWLHELTLRIS